MKIYGLLHIKSWTPRTMWKRMKATEWTIAFLTIAFVHCAVQLAFQVDARGAHLRAFNFLSHILNEASFQSRIAVLIPGGELYVCSDLPRGSADLSKECDALWSREIARNERMNRKLRSLQTVVPKDQAATVFNPILAGATPVPTPASSAFPSPTLAMESNDGLFSGGEGEADGSLPGFPPDDQGGNDDGPDRNLGPGGRDEDQLRPPSFRKPQNATSSEMPLSTTFSSSPSRPPEPTTEAAPLTSTTITPESSPTPTPAPTPTETSFTPPPPDLTTEQTVELSTSTQPELTTTTEVASTPEPPQLKVPPPTETSTSVETTTTSFSETSSSSIATTTSETTTTDLVTQPDTTTTTSASTSTSSSSSTSSATETSSTSVTETSSITQTSSAIAPEITRENGEGQLEEVQDGEDQEEGQEQENGQSQEQGNQRRSNLPPSAVLYVRQILPRRMGIDIDAVVTPSNMTGIQIQGLNPAPEGSVDVIYIGPECVESLNWPHQVIGNNLKEDTVFVAFEVWVLGISLIAVIGRSVPHLLAVFASHVLSTAWSIFTVYRTRMFQSEFDRVIHNGACGGVDLLPLLDAMRRPGEIGSLIVEAISLLIYILVTWKLYNDFGWEIWKLTSGSSIMKRVYRIVLALSVLIQLGLFFLASTGAIWLDQLFNGPLAPFTRHRTIYQLFFTFITILIVPWLVMGWIAVRREMRRTLTTFIVLSFVFLANLTAMFASDVYLLTFTSWRFFAVMTITSSVIVVCVFTLGLICRVNFKHNLGYFLSHQQALNDASTGRSPRNSGNVSDLEKVPPPNLDSQGIAALEKSSLNQPVFAISTNTASNAVQKPSPVELLKRLLPYPSKPARSNGTIASFYSPSLSKLDGQLDIPKANPQNPLAIPPSPSLNIRNPFASPEDQDAASIYSSNSSAAHLPVRQSTVGPWTNSSTSPPPSALLSSLRQQQSIPESPHYTDSSRNSAGKPLMEPNSKLFPLGDGTSQPFASGVGPLEDVKMFTEAIRSGSLKKKGAGAGGLRLARKYSLGLK